MIVNKSDTLAGVKRHDYLPFGEELYAGTGGRTTTQGYTGDSVRQHFTGYEADGETGLNFAQARYQSPAQGRFTSVDPLGASANVASPQSFNRYTYVLNNPTNLTDPSGMIPYNGADQSWSDVANGFWGSYFDPNASHFGGPAAIAEAEARHDRWVDIDRAGGEYGDADYPKASQTAGTEGKVGPDSSTDGAAVSVADASLGTPAGSVDPLTGTETRADRIARIAAANEGGEEWRTSRSRRARRNKKA